MSSDVSRDHHISPSGPQSLRRVALENGDSPGPACRRGADLHWKTRDQKSVGRQRFQIVQLLDVAIADLAARFVPLPDDRGIAARREALGGVNERRIPRPAV